MSTTPVSRPESAGSLLAGRFELGEVLGRGGTAIVWAARDHHLHRDVAVKRVLDPTPVDIDRLEREARAAARIQDHRVVTVLDLLHDEDGLPFLVMEPHRDGTLADELRSGPLSPARLEQLTDDLLGALEAAHAAGILHSDIKPANVLATDAGFRVTDFGSASLETDPTTESDLMGTPAYVAPERLGGRRGTVRSDLFSAAIVLQEAATGQHPFRGDGPTGSIDRIRDGRAEPLPDDVPAGLAAAISAALAPDPARRPDSAAAMAAIVHSGQDSTVVLAADETDPTVHLPTAEPVRSADHTAVLTHAAPSSDSRTRRPPAAARPDLVDTARTWLAARSPQQLFTGLCVVILVSLFAVVVADSDDPTPRVPTQAAEPAEAPPDLDATLDRIVELGR